MQDDTLPQQKSPTAEVEPPPFGGSWKTLYVIVFANLALLTAFFYLFTRYFG